MTSENDFHERFGRELTFWSMVVLVFLIQLFLILLSSSKTRPPRQTSKNLVPVELVLGTEAEQIMKLRDPTLFILADGYGFSGDAWLNYDLGDFKIPEKMELPLWAKSAEELAGGSFNRSDTSGESFPPYELRYRGSSKPSEGERANISTPTESSVMELRGLLAKRVILESPDLPFWEVGFDPQVTVVSVSISDFGYVFTARVVGTSDSTVMDLKALKIAESLRFQPLIESGLSQDQQSVQSLFQHLTRGEIVFYWADESKSREE